MHSIIFEQKGQRSSSQGHTMLREAKGWWYLENPFQLSNPIKKLQRSCPVVVAVVGLVAAQLADPGPNPGLAKAASQNSSTSRAKPPSSGGHLHLRHSCL